MPDIRKIILPDQELDIVSKVDTTLTQENIPGDAKVIGDKLNDLNTRLSNLEATEPGGGSGSQDIINAEDVYFDEDLITTVPIGHITLTNGKGTIAAQGKNLKQVFDTIFVKELFPTITQPSVAISSIHAGAYEAGTQIVPKYNAVFNPGKYQYGPATRVSVTSWQISDTNGNTSTTQSGQFPIINVDDTSTYKITAKVNHTNGTIPVTNIGNAYPEGQIKAGSKNVVMSATISGYRNSFYGSLTQKIDIESYVIRGLTKTNKELENGSTFEVPVPIGVTRIIIAYPATLRDVSSITDVNGLGAEIKGSFKKSIIPVEGANGFNPIDYKVYTIDFANANDVVNKFAVKI